MGESSQLLILLVFQGQHYFTVPFNTPLGGEMASLLCFALLFSAEAGNGMVCMS